MGCADGVTDALTCRAGGHLVVSEQCVRSAAAAGPPLGLQVLVCAGGLTCEVEAAGLRRTAADLRNTLSFDMLVGLKKRDLQRSSDGESAHSGRKISMQTGSQLSVCLQCKGQPRNYV